MLFHDFLRKFVKLCMERAEIGRLIFLSFRFYQEACVFLPSFSLVPTSRQHRSVCYFFAPPMSRRLFASSKHLIFTATKRLKLRFLTNVSSCGFFASAYFFASTVETRKGICETRDEIRETGEEQGEKNKGRRTKGEEQGEKNKGRRTRGEE